MRIYLNANNIYRLLIVILFILIPNYVSSQNNNLELSINTTGYVNASYSICGEIYPFFGGGLKIGKGIFNNKYTTSVGLQYEQFKMCILGKFNTLYSPILVRVRLIKEVLIFEPGVKFQYIYISNSKSTYVSDEIPSMNSFIMGYIISFGSLIKLSEKINLNPKLYYSSNFTNLYEAASGGGFVELSTFGLEINIISKLK